MGSLIIKCLLVVSILASTQEVFAQHEELKQNVQAFEELLSEKFEKKEFNITEPNWGALNNSEPDWHLYYQWKAKEKSEDNLGRNGYKKIDMAFYAWERKDDGAWALKSWLEEFLEGRKVRPGRVVRVFEYAKPTVIIMDTSYVVISQMDCSDYFDDDYKEWVKTIERFFSNRKAMTLELKCEGPLEWTKNAPDPKAKKKKGRRR